MNEEHQDLIDEVKSLRDPIEEWPLNKLKKEANGGDDKGQNQVIDDLGIE